MRREMRSPPLNTSRFSEIKAFLRRNGLRIFLPLLLLLLSYMSCTIGREPVSNGLSATSTSARFLLPFVALLSAVGAGLKRYFASLSLFIGYHLGVALALVGTESNATAFLIIAITLATSLLLGAWLEIFSVLFKRWKNEAGQNSDT